MKIYISGIAGTGMGPLALMANNAGLTVTGSDRADGLITPELTRAKIPFEIGPQDGAFLKKSHAAEKIDWFVYTSALPEDHPELLTAKKLGLKTSKRDEFIAYLVSELGLKMVAVAGTHGKTTTTSMLIWAAQSLGLPAAHLVGTTLGFVSSGLYRQNDQFFIYEADEYDRNFLAFRPWLSVIPFVSYDHPDIYPTESDYKAAFEQFEAQSETVILGEGIKPDPRFTLVGEARKVDATLALAAIKQMCAASGIEVVEDKTANSLTEKVISEEKIIQILNTFPGVGRRFERLAAGVYTDYAHHPEEIAATVAMAREEAALRGFRGVVAVYEPHQNTRQHEVREGYKDAFTGVNQLFWLPTYLTRENPDLPVLTPEDFIAGLSDPSIGESAEMGDKLSEKLCILRDEGELILLMTAGPADDWLRKEVVSWEQ